MTRYSPGVYVLINRGTVNDRLNYTLDNQPYKILGDTMLTLCVYNCLEIPTSGDIVTVQKVANHPDQIKGSAQYAL